MPPSTCQRCGFDRIETPFCPLCGARVGEAPPPSEPVPRLPFTPEPPQQTAPGPTPDGPPPGVTIASLGSGPYIRAAPTPVPSATPTSPSAPPIPIAVAPPKPALATPPPVAAVSAAPTLPVASVSAAPPPPAAAPGPPPGALLGAYAMLPPEENELGGPPMPLPPRPRPRPTAPGGLPHGAPPGVAAPAPVPAASLESIPIGRHESAPAFETVAPPPPEEICETCGAPVYPSMIRCPHCLEPYPTKSAPSLPARPWTHQRPRVRRMSSPLATVVVSVSVAALAGVAAIVYALTAASDEGSATMEDAVRGFYAALLEGKVEQSLTFVSPEQRKLARQALEILEKDKVPVDRIVARAVQALGKGRVDFEVGAAQALSDEKGKVQVLFRSGGLPMRRTWTPTIRRAGRWFVDANPFGGPGH